MCLKGCCGCASKHFWSPQGSSCGGRAVHLCRTASCRRRLPWACLAGCSAQLPCIKRQSCFERQSCFGWKSCDLGRLTDCPLVSQALTYQRTGPPAASRGRAQRKRLPTRPRAVCACPALLGHAGCCCGRSSLRWPAGAGCPVLERAAPDDSLRHPTAADQASPSRLLGKPPVLAGPRLLLIYHHCYNAGPCPPWPQLEHINWCVQRQDSCKAVALCPAVRQALPHAMTLLFAPALSTHALRAGPLHLCFACWLLLAVLAD
jgi:hypothetical protein